MRITILLLMLMLFLPGPVLPADRWTEQDVILEGTYCILKVIDWKQTRNIVKHPDKFWEMNPILGRHPSINKVDTYFISTAILHTIISHYLPKKYRTWWQIMTITMSGTLVVHNISIGLRY